MEVDYPKKGVRQSHETEIMNVLSVGHTYICKSKQTQKLR